MRQVQFFSLTCISHEHYVFTALNSRMFFCERISMVAFIVVWSDLTLKISNGSTFTIFCSVCVNNSNIM